MSDWRAVPCDFPLQRPSKNGYVCLTRFVNGVRLSVSAHRAAYEAAVGPIPAGMTLDHLCHDPRVCRGGWKCPHRACREPQHLEAVTGAENTRRGAGALRRSLRASQ